MPLPGGASDKLGNSYEAAWTVAVLLDLLQGRHDCMRLEPPGQEGIGIEFWVEKEGIRAYHQVKRQHTATGRWTLADLERVGILGAFFSRLKGTQHHCVFASTQDAYELRELSERARGATSWPEFERAFLKADQQRRAFDRLRSAWSDLSEPDAFDLLRRIRVDVMDERSLQRLVETLAVVTCDGNPVTVVDALARLALDRIHEVLTAADVWAYLRTRNLDPRDWAQNTRVLRTVDDLNDRYLCPLARSAAGGREIERDEVQEALALLQSPAAPPQDILVSGEAGVGKSFVILQLVRVLRTAGVPVLAFRLDRLEPAANPDTLGKQLGLPASPVRVLAAIAKGRPCVLLVDQLDAVSLTSGRNPHFFSCVEAIIEEAKAIPSLRLVMACRAFDLSNDHRFRRLVGDGGVAKEVSVSRLSNEAVRAAVEALGLDSKELGDRQIRLLAVPLHLELLAQIIAGANSSSSALDSRLDFQTAKDLYDRYWNRKRQALRERQGTSVDWLPALDALSDYMSAGEILSAPRRVLSKYEDVAELLVSEHVIAEEGGRYAFFHEGFFDYVFARRFADRDRRLLDLLLGGEQALFRRAQVRQILLHERDADREQYIRDLRDVLHHKDIRFHIKQVIFSLLGTRENPTKAEWEVLAPFLERGEDATAESVRRLLWGAAPWFILLNDLGVIEAWMHESEDGRGNLADFAVRLIGSVMRMLPDRVASCLAPLLPYVTNPEPDSTWHKRLASLPWTEIKSRTLFDIYLALYRNDFFVRQEREVFSSNVRYVLEQLQEKHPDWACEAVGVGLQAELARLVNAPEQDQPSLRLGFRGYGHEGELLNKLADLAPAAFIQHVFPFVLAAVDRFAMQELPKPWPDKIWWWLQYKDTDLPQAVLYALVTAFAHIAKTDETSYRATLDILQERSDAYATAQYLLVRAYEVGGATVADEALLWLAQEERRLQVGYSSSPHWATRELLNAVTPKASDEAYAAMEATVLNYYSEWERKQLKNPDWSALRAINRPTGFGYAQYVLLEGIASSRLSPEARRRLGEWRRKFGTVTRPPGPPVVSAVGPPRSVQRGNPDLMGDEDWIRAVMRYDADETRGRIGDIPYGGARQLAQVLKAQANTAPARFVRLADQLPDDAHPCYFEALLLGVAEAKPSPELVMQLVERCHALPGQPCGRFIVDLLGRHPSLSYTDRTRVAEIVTWYAFKDPDPRREMWQESTMNGDLYYSGDPHFDGINTTRGSAAKAIGRFVFEDSTWLDLFRPALDEIVCDSSTAVRACVAFALLPVLNHDRPLAVQLFRRLCAETNDALLGTTFIEHFLYHSAEQAWDQLGSLVKRAVCSENRSAQAVGARQATLVSLVSEAARPLGEACLSGNETQRAGAAQIYAANLRQARFKGACERTLGWLLNDENDAVRAATATCFNDFEEDQLGDYEDLIQAFADSAAFEKHYELLVDALSKTTAYLPEATCHVAQRFVETFGYDAGNPAGRAAYIADTVATLVVRTYSQADDATLRNRCLDLIDQMTIFQGYRMSEALREFER